MSFPALFRLLVLRYLLGTGRAGDRLRTVLSLAAIALGVAVVLAIQLANGAAIGSFQESIRQVSGAANLSITGAAGIDELLLPELRNRLNAIAGYEVEITPRLESYGVIPSTQEVAQVVGIDLLQRTSLAAGSNRLAVPPESFLLAITDPRSILVASDIARRYHLTIGSSLPLILNDRQSDYIVRGIFGDEPSGSTVSGLLLMDIAAAQLALGKIGKLDRIDVAIRPEQLDSYSSRLSATLPAGLRVERPETRAEQTDKMLRAFRWNLAALSYVSLLVGAFLIYNTVAISVVRRRAEIGALRALGASRKAILWLFLSEAALLGLLASALGVLLGRILASGALRLVSSTVSSLYAPASPQPIHLTAVQAVEAVAIGMGTAVISAIPPALEATGVLPSEAMQRGAHEQERRVAKWRYAAAGAATLALAGAAAAAPPVLGFPLFGYAAVLLVITGFALLMPMLLTGFTEAIQAPFQWLVGIEGLLAARQMKASPARITVLTMALATAVAMMVSVAIMVGSFRRTVEVWARQTLRADLFLKPAALLPGAHNASIPEPAISLLAQTPGVAAVDPFQSVETIYGGDRVVLGAGDWETLVHYGNLLFLDGRSPAQVMQGDTTRAAVVSEPFANHHGVKSGDSIVLDTPSGRVAFRVAGVYYDYTNDRGTIVIDRKVFQALFHDRSASNLAIYLTEGADLDTVRRELAERLASRGYSFIITPNAELQSAVMRVFDRTFAITYALEAVAILVATLGIANALLAWVIERRRELGVLRVLGASRIQLRKLVLADSALVGLVGLAAGGVMGTLLSWILIFTINKQSFGWTIQLAYPLAFLATASAAIFVVTVAAGWFPARVAARFAPAEVIATE